MSSPVFQALRLSQLPLCVSYRSVHLTPVRVYVRERGLPAGCTVAWGLGDPSDGDFDVVGVWVEPAGEGGSKEALVGELRERGLECFGLLINGQSEASGSALVSAFPAAAVASPFHPVAELVMRAASPGDLKAVAQGLGRVRQAQSAAHAHAVLDSLAAAGWRGSPVAVQRCRAAIGQWQAVYALSRRARERVRRFEDAAWALQQGVSRALARHGPFDSAEAAAAFAEDWLRDAQRRRQHCEVVARHRAGVAAARAG